MHDDRDSTDDEEPSDHHASRDGHHVNEGDENASDSEREETQIEQSILEEAEGAAEADYEVNEQN